MYTSTALIDSGRSFLLAKQHIGILLSDISEKECTIMVIHNKALTNIHSSMAANDWII